MTEIERLRDENARLIALVRALIDDSTEVLDAIDKVRA